MKTFERMLPTEADDIREIVAGILRAQSRFAAAQHRPLERGTHTKGVCVRGTFEVFDLNTSISDPVLRERLARSVFAKPGVYPATIRFANAESTFQPDYTPDVRAMSFAMTLPDGTRHDFSMNNATTFPINDAHAFAVLMRVLEAGSRWNRIKALTTLSPVELGSIVMMGIRAKQQKGKPIVPFQRTRWWSGVPFRHGPDEAAKYSASARPENSALDPERSENMLRDELLRHVEADQRMSEFDFAVQLLDADAMRRRGRKRDEVYWVENASVEWPEDQAPFHVVGRLTLERDSALSDEDSRNFFIDVNEYSTPDTHPLGSINRARWFAESASRRRRLEGTSGAVPAVDPLALPDARTGAPLPAAATTRGTWVGSITLHSLARVFGIVAIATLVFVTGLAIATMIYVNVGGGMLPAEPPDRIVYADRGFGSGVDAATRQTFYFTPQGAGLKDIRYRWFVNLEMPWGRTRISDPAVLTRYGFLVDQVTDHNPDRLPVGFSKHFDQGLNEEMLDVTCAACHTGQIQVRRSDGRVHALRIDGGQADHAFTDASFGHFLPTLISSMVATAVNPIKFNRFANRVFGEGNPGDKWALHRELRAVIRTFAAIKWNEVTRGLSPLEEGYGRTDALARIGNTVFAENLTSKNYKVGNAPVNFPSLWNIWKFDWVQYNASVSQPMARNMGEAMGVGAKYVLVDPYGAPLPPSERFRSTANLQNLDVIEQTLRKLQPPEWREDVLGKIDTAKAREGHALFDQHCIGCHGPHVASPAMTLRNSPLKGDSLPEWIVATLCVDDIGTDPMAATNFDTATVDITRTGLTAMDLRRVARKGMEESDKRQAEYLNTEIQRLRLFAQPESAAIITKYETEIRRQHDVMEEHLAQLDPSKLPLGAALSYLGTMIREKAYADGRYTPDEQRIMDGFGALDMPQIMRAYKARPLQGVWATPPFLHNGSVPTIYDLLSPVAERPHTFQVGSHAYDTLKAGLADTKGFWTFDTKPWGNHNTGHEFGPGYLPYTPGHHPKQPRPGLIGPPLTSRERYAIIEYLKIRNDNVDGLTKPHEIPACGESH